jgi:hypothetical protein
MNNPCLKCLWYFLSCILCTFAILLIIIFFLFFGCPYEFIKCYLKNDPNIDDDDSVDDYYIPAENEFRPEDQNNVDKEKESKECTCGVATVCVFLAILGFFMQPLYLLFYILYGMMECYRRMGCWVFWIGN